MNALYRYVINPSYFGGIHLANHKSAIKRARQSIRRAKRNQSTTSNVKTFERKLRAAIAGKKADEVPELLKAYSSRISKAVQKGVIKFETASRKLSRLSTLVHKSFSA